MVIISFIHCYSAVKVLRTTLRELHSIFNALRVVWGSMGPDNLVYIGDLSLCKIPKFHLISWCGVCENVQCPGENFGWVAFLQNFHTRKLGEITVIYAVYISWNQFRVYTPLYCFPLFSSIYFQVLENI